MLKKICTRCEESKFITEFYRQHTTRDGLQAICKICETVIAENRVDINDSISNDTKICNTCLLPRGLNDFHRDIRGIKGRKAICKRCHSRKGR